MIFRRFSYCTLILVYAVTVSIFGSHHDNEGFQYYSIDLEQKNVQKLAVDTKACSLDLKNVLTSSQLALDREKQIM